MIKSITNKKVTVERFAPSPTGHLHLGNVFSAVTAFNNAKRHSGLFKLRIEDIDFHRCRKEFEKQIISDLLWLGIKWYDPILRQSGRRKIYYKVLKDLQNRGLIYKCCCTRRDIKKALSAPHKSDNRSIVYPGTCLHKNVDGNFVAYRLNIKKTLQNIDSKSLKFFETGHKSDQEGIEQRINPDELITKFGDIVIARKDIGTSYNLAVVVDDAEQNVTHVTRGDDLFDVTPIQVLLQNILSIPTPVYNHHKLILDDLGNRMAKRSYSNSIVSLKERGITPAQIFDLLSVKVN